MQPAAACFAPLHFQAGRVGEQPTRLRAARFAADPSVPARGLCVLLNGQTEFIEKYFEVIDELRMRGYGVATFDWRGQGGSDRLLADDSRKGYITDFAGYDEDLAAFMAQIVEPMKASLLLARDSAQEGEAPVAGQREARPSSIVNPARERAGGQQRVEGVEIIALAHSMGGHNLLRYLSRHPDAFAKAILTAPMVAVSFRGNAAWVVALVTRLQSWTGRGAHWVWGMETRDPHRVDFTRQMVTSDPARFERTQKVLRDHPDLRLAGATWAWLAAAMRSMAWLKNQAAKITTPLLVIGAGADRIVITAQTRAFAARLPHARYVEIEGAGHEMLMERDEFRASWWNAVDAFLQS